MAKYKKVQEWLADSNRESEYHASVEISVVRQRHILPYNGNMLVLTGDGGKVYFSTVAPFYVTPPVTAE